MTISIFAATQTGDLVETAGVVTGVANVEQAFTTGMINEVMSPYTGGKTFTTGLGKFAGALVTSYTQMLAVTALMGKFGRNPYPFLPRPGE